MKEIFHFIKASKFFPKYAPSVTNWKHKLRGKDGHKNPIEFTDQEKRIIRTGVKELFKDLKK